MSPVRSRSRSFLGWRFLLALLLSVAVTGPITAAAHAATAHMPIVFVHGWKEGPGVWTTDIARFQADGYAANELYNFAYDTTQSNVTTAQQLKAYIANVKAATGWSKVDVVTHSMGGLNSRYYIKFLGGTNDVDDWVSLGGPNHGTQTANGCPEPSCIEMRPGSAFLNQLNAGDETPGYVNYGTWWSPCDEVIIPQTSTILSGAKNTQTACMEHIQETQDQTVYQQVRDFVRPN
jgi:triacylglycerol lipase